MTEFDRKPTLGLERRSAVLNGKKVRYLENKGDYSTINPLVMIPGWPVSADTLSPLMQELGGEIKCYALNLPGFGGSETDYRTDHSFSYYSDFVDQFRENIVDSEKVNLLGYSTGGVLGIMYDTKYQDSLDKLIVFSPPYNGIEHYNQASEKDLRFFQLFVLLRKYRQLTLPLNNRLVKGRLVETIIRDNYLERYPEFFHTDIDFIQELIEETSKFDFKAIVDMASDLSGHDFSDEASKVRSQTLVIAAGKDEAVAPDSIRHLSTLIQGSQFELIPDVDHAVGIAEPEKMVHLILDFLNG